MVGRELSVAEIAEVRANTGAEVEAFVHGALCVSYRSDWQTPLHSALFIYGLPPDAGSSAVLCCLPDCASAYSSTALQDRKLRRRVVHDHLSDHACMLALYVMLGQGARAYTAVRPMGRGRCAAACHVHAQQR